MARRKNKQKKGQAETPVLKKKPIPEEESEDESEEEQAVVVSKGSKKKLQESEEEHSDDSDEEQNSEEEESEDEEDVKGSRPFFSDENTKWLKPKKKEGLLDSDNDDDDDDDDEKSGSDEDASGESDEEEEMLDIEREAYDEDQERLLEEDEADTEMRRTISQHTSLYHLPTAEEMARDTDRVVPPSEIRGHIESILEVLADFKARREPGRARAEYIELLGGFIAEQYGYLPELVDYFLTMLGAAECLEFIDASDKPRPLVVRTNTLKTRRKDLAAALMKRGVSLDPLAAWSKVGLKIVESPVPVGATPEYLSGQYMLQSAASMCPVLALSPEPKERVMDMAAAPGGKTSYIAQLMRNTGTILANDLKSERQKATVANMHRLGVKNVITCTHDGRKMGTLFKNRFDRILLDAPCSGLGVISRDPSVKVQRTMADVKKCAHLQKELLLAAIDALKFKNTTGGVMVYSTCSVAIAENEEVVQYALEKRDIRIVDAGLDFGKPGFVRYQHKRFHPSMALTRRFYPHVHNMDGFFVCKIQKLSDGPATTKVPVVEDGEPVAADEGSSKKELDKKTLEEKTSKKKKSPGKRARKDFDKKPVQEEEDADAIKKKRKSDVSVPPNKQNKSSNKKTKNAKVTKPRRNNPARDM